MADQSFTKYCFFNKDLLLNTRRRILSDILSNILSDILSGILSDMLSDILSGKPTVVFYTLFCFAC